MPRRRAGSSLAPAALGMLAIACVACGSAGTPQVVVVGDAQAAEPVAGSSQIVLELANSGDGDDVLLVAESPAALGVEFHLTTIEGGRASMGELDEVELPAGGSVQFRPGGLHLMMVVPDESVVLGGSLELTLRFERSDPLVVPVEVVDLLDLAESSFEEPQAPGGLRASAVDARDADPGRSPVVARGDGEPS